MTPKQENDAAIITSLGIKIIGIVILSIGLTDIFLDNKASFWSILYVITGIVLITQFRFSNLRYLQVKKLEKELG